MSSIRLLMYQVVVIFLAHSIGMISSFHWNALMQSRGVRRPSVCLSVNFAQIASSTTNMTRSPPNLNTMVPRWACIQGVLKVKVKGHVIRTLSAYTKIASSTTNMTRSPPNLHTMIPRWACIQGVLKVKVNIKGHVIRTVVISRKSLLLSGK